MHNPLCEHFEKRDGRTDTNLYRDENGPKGRALLVVFISEGNMYEGRSSGEAKANTGTTDQSSLWTRLEALLLASESLLLRLRLASDAWCSACLLAALAVCDACFLSSPAEVALEYADAETCDAPLRASADADEYADESDLERDVAEADADVR